jgi:hypothetical protein
MKALKSVLEIPERILRPPKARNLRTRRRIRAEAMSKLLTITKVTTAKALRCKRGARLCDIFEHPGFVT